MGNADFDIRRVCHVRRAIQPIKAHIFGFFAFFFKLLASKPSGSNSVRTLWTKCLGALTLCTVVSFWFNALKPKSFPGPLSSWVTAAEIASTGVA